MEKLSSNLWQESDQPLPMRFYAPGSGPVVGLPPETGRSGRGSSYWKFENKNPRTRYDFWFTLTMVQNGDIFTITKAVPLADGGIIFFIRRREYKTTLETTYIKTLKSEHDNFGIVRFSRLKVKEFYEGIQKTIYDYKFEVRRFDADNNLVENAVTDTYPFPPLVPGDVNSRDAMHQYLFSQLDQNRFQARGLIIFPKFKKLSDTDFELDDGHEQETDRHTAPVLVKPKALPPFQMIYEFTEQQGNPSSSLELWMMTDEQGLPKPFFGHFGTSFREVSVYHQIFIKKKRSWFRKKTKITILRKEFRVSGVTYSALHF